MNLLRQLYGEEGFNKYIEFTVDHPNMHEDWYVRQVIRTLNQLIR
jgi:hypothetical protein